MVKALFVLIPFLIILASDQWTKHIVLERFQYGESLPVFPPWFSLTYVRNTGAAFSFLANAPDAFRVPFFLIIPILALVLLGFLYREFPANAKWRTLALGLISGGAIGNWLDRLRFGYVVDFLDFHYYNQWYFPAFNVADSAICVGVGILFLASLKKETPENASNTV